MSSSKSDHNQNNGASVQSEDSKKEDSMDRRMMLVVFASLVVDLIAFTMILPLLPALLDYYGHHDQVR